MDHKEKRRFLIRGLLDEWPQYKKMAIPEEDEEQRRLLRSLMNIRPPRPVDEGFLKIQDAYLQEEVEEKGVTDVESLTPSPSDERLILWRGDITTLRVDGIVNAANSALRGCFVPCHSCVDNIIHSVSGIQLRLACDALMNAQGHDEPIGCAKITPAFNLPCRYVLHAVGPVVGGRPTKRDGELLASCYRSCLELAEQNGVKSVAFCCISTGEFHFPYKKAAQIAVKTVKEHQENTHSSMEVIFNVFKETDFNIYRELLGAN